MLILKIFDLLILFLGIYYNKIILNIEKVLGIKINYGIICDSEN